MRTATPMVRIIPCSRDFRQFTFEVIDYCNRCRILIIENRKIETHPVSKLDNRKHPGKQGRSFAPNLGHMGGIPGDDLFRDVLAHCNTLVGTLVSEEHYVPPFQRG